MFTMGPMESGVCKRWRSFVFTGKTYKTLYAAHGFICPSFRIKDVTREDAGKGLSLSILSNVEGRGRKVLYPVEVIDRDRRSIQSNLPGQLVIQTETYSESADESGYPGRIRELIGDAWMGSLLPRKNDVEKLLFKNGGLSAVFNVPLPGLNDRDPVEVNHVGLFIGESAGPGLPRYAAQMVYSNFSIKNIFDLISQDNLLRSSFLLMADHPSYGHDRFGDV